MFSTLDQVYDELKKDGVSVSKKYTYSHKIKTKNKTIRMSLGRIWFNLILPDDYKLIDEPVTKGAIKNILNDMLNKYSTEVVADVASTLNKEAFKMQTIQPTTFTDDDFILPDSIRKLKEDRLVGVTDPLKFQENLKFIANEYLKYLKKNKSSLYTFIVSGAKGSPIDMAILIVAKGSTVDIEGNISTPTTNSINDGFTLKEFYQNANEARSGLYTRSIGSSEPGALSRDIVYANSNIKLGEKDCKTRNYFEIKINDTLAKTLVGRWYLKGSGLVEIKDPKDVIGKTIKLRSPLYCKSKSGVCQTCFGSGSEKLNTRNVGVMAGALINTEGLNSYSMKARHNSSNVQAIKADYVKDQL